MIAVFVGGRSDGGILAPLIERMGADVIECDSLLTADTDKAVAQSAGLTAITVAERLSSRRYDAFVILGDRFEALAAAMSAYNLGIPIAHLHGGEVTLGSRDDARRHAITQMAGLHLTATEKAAEKVRSFGKDEVYVIGAIGAYNARHAPASPDPVDVIVAVPAEPDVYGACIAATEGMNRLVIGGNADVGKSRIQGVTLAPDQFLAALKSAKVIVGNTSAGIIEAPSAGTWTINVGDRQAGRESAESVMDIPVNAAVIREVTRAMLDSPFPDTLVNPYEQSDPIGYAAELIQAIL